MGISASKRVSHHFRTSQEFTSSCNTIFSDLQTLTQHASPGQIFAYQLPDAALRLHNSLSSPPLKTWCPSPPSRAQVDGAYRSLRRKSPPEETLSSDEFREFAIVMFTDAIVSNASKAVASKVCVGVAGIAGVGMVARIGGGLVGSVIGIYAIGIATSVYVSLG
ncbi:hypothetical protein SOVF_017230 [Spinacia oleracea]|uniref:GDT1 family protein n=1 Tax=Spinacia oleracea TaxID=3562 RepID=A0A9R0IA91_SPIOL|nr:uncharacterized protein LOC110785391 [Spinacia oleracea]KNA24263.1 hypothetical protein SOVF_017230 [Spinacia oleracea]